MPKSFTVFFLLAGFSLFLFPKTLHAQRNYTRQRNEVFAVNILSNGLMGGVGGVIHKKKGEKWLPVFLRNFGKGCLGGLVKYNAKSQAYYLNDPNNTFIAPFNRLYYFLGHSMVMNAAQNKKLLSTYYCNMYGLDIRVRAKTAEQDRFQVRLSLGTIAYAAAFGFVGHRLDLYKTLEYGQPYFVMKEHYKIPGRTDEIRGVAGYNVLSVANTKDPWGREFPIYSVIPHEAVHTLQFNDLTPLTCWYQPFLEPEYKKNKTYRFLSKYIYADLEPIFFFDLAYTLQPKPIYYKNWLEFEAEHFSSRAFIQR